MKTSINFTETAKLPQHIQLAIYHNPENAQLQTAFPTCFIDDGLGTQQIPWSYINKKGYIGKFNWSIDYDSDDTVADYVEAPMLDITSEIRWRDYPDHVFIDSSDSFWKPFEMDTDTIFKPYIYNIKEIWYLVIGRGEALYAKAIPLAIIDFSK